jgi:sterol desaturase/sphingolipid hydroxylase (fatty acid hydroxylase superfamily)
MPRSNEAARTQNRALGLASTLVWLFFCFFFSLFFFSKKKKKLRFQLLFPPLAFVCLWELCKATMSNHELHIGATIVVVVSWIFLLFLSFLNVPQMCYKLGKLGVSITYSSPAVAFLLPIALVLLAFVQVVINHIFLFLRMKSIKF